MIEVYKNTHNSARKRLLLAACSAGLICLLVYLRSLWCGFSEFDDPNYIVNNPLIKSLDEKTLLRIFTEPFLEAWIPLTLLTFILDYHFWGLNPTGYHLTNSLLHAVNTVLVVLLAEQLLQYLPIIFEPIRNNKYLYPAMLLLIGLIFGLHPMRVESVVWISERKDVLNGLLLLSSIIFYLRYVQNKSFPGKNIAARRDYCISIGLFILSLMAKQVSVILPAMLMVIDWYPLRRFGKGEIITILLEKIPYFVFSFAVVFLTISLASKGQRMITIDEFPIYARCLVSGNSVYEYCRYLIFPIGLVPVFAMGDTIQVSFIVKSGVVIAFTCFCVASVKKWPLFGAVWFSFLLPLLPVLAFMQASDDTSIASRYTYLPSVAPSIAAGILLAVGYVSLTNKRPGLARILIPSLVIVLITSYSVITLQLIPVWKDPEAFWTRQIEIQPLGRAYSFRGKYYMSIGRYNDALEDLSTALSIAQQVERADNYILFAYRGATLQSLGLHEKAINDFTAAINLSPHPLYYYMRGCSLKALGRVAEAEESFRLAGPNPPPIDWF